MIKRKLSLTKDYKNEKNLKINVIKLRSISAARERQILKDGSNKRFLKENSQFDLNKLLTLDDQEHFVMNL